VALGNCFCIAAFTWGGTSFSCTFWAKQDEPTTSMNIIDQISFITFALNGELKQFAIKMQFGGEVNLASLAGQQNAISQTFLGWYALPRPS
jgi:hypothetical protein